MKKIIRTLVITSFMVVSVSLSTAWSQPVPGNQSNGSNTGGAPIGGGTAPVGSGMIILMVLASGYGVKKYLETGPENQD